MSLLESLRVLVPWLHTCQFDVQFASLINYLGVICYLWTRSDGIYGHKAYRNSCLGKTLSYDG